MLAARSAATEALQVLDLEHVKAEFQYRIKQYVVSANAEGHAVTKSARGSNAMPAR